MKGSTNSSHDFSEVLGDEHIEHLVDFLMNGLIDEALFIDYDTKQPFTFDLGHGEGHFSTVCSLCHGTDGKTLNFGDLADPEYLGTVAVGNPWETIHKIRFGQPGSPMPSALVSGWDIQMVLDVLAYAQTLPEE